MGLAPAISGRRTAERTPKGRLGRPRSRPGRLTRGWKVIRSNREELQEPREGGGRPVRGPAPSRVFSGRGHTAQYHPARRATTLRVDKGGPGWRLQTSENARPYNWTLDQEERDRTPLCNPDSPLPTRTLGTLISTFAVGAAAGRGRSDLSNEASSSLVPLLKACVEQAAKPRKEAVVLCDFNVGED